MTDAGEGFALGTDEKTERLLNLVIALLGTKSFMKKSEILKVIPGYTGTLEARERMFERDKEDLRKAGIAIQVSSLDPLFDDEQGYRISKSDYGFQLGSLSTEEYLVMTAALQLMESRIDLIDGKSLKRSIFASHGGELSTSTATIDGIRHGFDLPDGRLVQLLLHIRNRERVRFIYQSEREDEVEPRVISPRAIGRKRESWLLIGFDHERESLRTFNLLQIIGRITPVDGAFFEEAVDSASEFSGFHKDPELVRVKVETRLAPFFELEGGKVTGEDEDFSEIEFHVPHPERLMRILLSLTPSYQVVSPDSAVEEFSRLKAKLLDAS